MIPLHYKTKGMASHQPLLIAVAKTIKKGRICEYGAGDYSTGLLHQICQENENVLFTFDNDERWLNRQAALWPGFHWHSYHRLVDYTDLLDINHDFSCDLAFIDGYTYGSRLFCIQQTLASNWIYMIVHDADFIVNGHTGYMDVFAKHKAHTFVYDKFKPATLLVTRELFTSIEPDYETEEL
jgi:hypothetical protein